MRETVEADGAERQQNEQHAAQRQRRQRQKTNTRKPQATIAHRRGGTQLILEHREGVGPAKPGFRSEQQYTEETQHQIGADHGGEHIRIFPLSNWTELDVWQYVDTEGIELPSIYYAHRRTVVDRGGMLMAVNEFVRAAEGETPFEETVRYRTVGDATCTAAVRSGATTPGEVIAEVAATRITERGATRADDKTSDAAMEDRKREGYF